MKHYKILLQQTIAEYRTELKILYTNTNRSFEKTAPKLILRLKVAKARGPEKVVSEMIRNETEKL